jgi:uncharacterized membrane protein YebE (DUF533 family)
MRRPCGKLETYVQREYAEPIIIAQLVKNVNTEIKMAAVYVLRCRAFNQLLFLGPGPGFHFHL